MEKKGTRLCKKKKKEKKGTRLCTRAKKTCSGKLEKTRNAVLRMDQLLCVDNIELPLHTPPPHNLSPPTPPHPSRLVLFTIVLLPLSPLSFYQRH